MPSLADPALTIALALAIGVLAQALAHHIRMPGIVVLLVLGVLLGPDGLGVIWPAALGSGLATLVGFAVAVILFEGGMNLNLERLRREQGPIRRLVSVGAAVTAIGGTLIARFCLVWDWRTSFLFGTLVIVTGPTVVNPLLRRLRVERSVGTILEAEGVLGDPIGAIVAVVALEIALHPSGSVVAFGPVALFGRLAFGAAVGGCVGYLLGSLLRFKSVVPNGLENVFILSLVLALFQGSNAVVQDTGIPAVASAGVVLGNLKGIRVQRELLEFKEQLTVLLIGLLFILLAADVRLRDIQDLGLRGVLALLLLLVVLRPLTVFLSLWGTRVTLKQRLFMSWIGPRGIIAAAIASMFATQLAENDVGGGQKLRALVFLVVAGSVLSAGVMGGLVGRLLGVRTRTEGWVILGANALAAKVALALQRGGEEVVCIDTDAEACRSASAQGISTLCGDGVEETMMFRAGIEHRRGALAVTSNDEVNYLFVKRVQEAAKVRTLSAVNGGSDTGRVGEVGRDLGSELLFGHPHDVAEWCARIGRQAGTIQSWRLGRTREGRGFRRRVLATDLLVFVAIRDRPTTSGMRLRRGDVAVVLVDEERLDQAHEWLVGHGWALLPQ